MLCYGVYMDLHTARRVGRTSQFLESRPMIALIAQIPKTLEPHIQNPKTNKNPKGRQHLASDVQRLWLRDRPPEIVE